MAAIDKQTVKGFYAIALARIGLGFIFLWAFFDKMFGLGFSTCRDKVTDVISKGCEQAMVSGGSPTTGYLDNATKGPFADFYQGLAGQGWVDYLFMAGLLAVGVGLTLGIAVKLSAVAGTLMMFMMWSATLLPANNPLIDDHIIYILLLAVIYLTNSQQKWGLRCWWVKQPLVKSTPFLE